MTSHTRRIAEFATNLTLETVPASVKERAKRLVLDGIGCGLFAARVKWTNILAEVVKQLEPGGGASVIWGRGETASAVSAALVNGTMIQGYELDDANLACFHSAAVVLPAAFAAAEVIGADRVDGDTLLKAIIAGFEIGPRVGLCMNGDRMIINGWHAPGIFGPFAASIAAGIVLGLNADEHFHALGIAGTQASGLMAAQFGSMVKRMQCAKNAQSGLYAALLAAKGFTGIANVFEEKFGGYCTTFTQSTDRFDLDALTSGLGERWETNRIQLKRHACLGTNMAAIDATEELKKEHGFAAVDVDCVVVAVTETTQKHGGWSPYVPSGLTGAQMHMGFCVATMLIEGEVFVDQMIEANAGRQDLVDLANRVQVVRDASRESLPPNYARGADVEVRLKGGAVFKKKMDFFIGSEERPLSEQQLLGKYRRLASETLAARNLAEVESIVLDLDHAPATTGLVELLRGG
jgi:aconitate decarboxylase